MTTAILLMAHGSRISEANDAAREIAARVKTMTQFDIVEVSFREQHLPNIQQGVDNCVAQGAKRILLVPYFLYMGAHVLEDLPAAGTQSLLAALRARHLFKRAFEAPAAELPMEQLEWIADDRRRTRRAERALGARLGLADGEVLFDFPAKTQMLGLDLLVRSGDGTIRRLKQEGFPGNIDLPRLSDQLYRSARWLRVFTVRRAQVTRALLDEVLREV